MKVGEKIKFEGEVQRYTVQACDGRYIIASKPFNARRTYLYTIVDLEAGYRSPCNLLFGPYEDVNNVEGATALLKELRAGTVGLSNRRRKDLSMAEHSDLMALSQ